MGIALALLLTPWLVGGIHVAVKHHRARHAVVQAYPASREAEARSIELGPYPELQKTETFCAWCHPGEDGPTGSHGICAPHAAEVLRDYDCRLGVR